MVGFPKAVNTILPKEINVAYLCDHDKSCADENNCSNKFCHLTLDPAHALNKNNVSLIKYLLEICKEVEENFDISYDRDHGEIRGIYFSEKVVKNDY